MDMGIEISIHALREEGDPGTPITFEEDSIFLSTPSARRATLIALRHGADHQNFYPRPPRGGRPGRNNRPAALSDISIHALREEGDRGLRTSTPPRNNFYPRPPRGGRPPSAARACSSSFNFYPRPPRGGRPITSFRPSPIMDFYPRPPRGGRPIWQLFAVDFF